MVVPYVRRAEQPMSRLVACCLVIGPLCCCSRSDETAWSNRFQRHAEALAGARAAAELESTCGGIYLCPEAQARLDRVGSIVAGCCDPHGKQTWQFQLLGSSDPNAYSLPLNRIYLTRGLYERIGNDDALLAAAIAHEMAHIHYRDSFKPECHSPEATLARESTADGQALEYLRQSEYPAESLCRLLLLIADAQPEGWARARITYLASR